jgi:prepilin-type processing-associated H-X9-DG protein
MTGRNNGAFWYQSGVRVAAMTDGTSSTAVFSERCLGNSQSADRLADYYLSSDSLTACLASTPLGTPRFTSPYEWSGERWGDGNALYTRYHHIFPPLSVSCLLGGSEDFDSPVVVTATSRHPGGVNLSMADGSVRFVKQTVAARVWQAIGTVAGSEIVSQSDY